MLRARYRSLPDPVGGQAQAPEGEKLLGTLVAPQLGFELLKQGTEAGRTTLVVGTLGPPKAPGELLVDRLQSAFQTVIPVPAGGLVGVDDLAAAANEPAL